MGKDGVFLSSLELRRHSQSMPKMAFSDMDFVLSVLSVATNAQNSNRCRCPRVINQTKPGWQKNGFSSIMNSIS